MDQTIVKRCANCVQHSCSGCHAHSNFMSATPAKPKSAMDAQEGGDHYKKMGMYQPWEVAYAQMTPEELKGAMKITVMSYLSREADKGGMADIKKAAHTLQIYLELEARRSKK